MLLATAANSPPFYRDTPRFSRPNSRLISLDPLELSKFSTLTDTNTAVAPPRALLCNQFRIVSRELHSRRYCGTILSFAARSGLTFRAVGKIIEPSRARAREARERSFVFINQRPTSKHSRLPPHPRQLRSRARVKSRIASRCDELPRARARSITLSSRH